ncbi:MAG TPA: GDP-mannose 4,6-dehydratase [Solirubrobacteraceae bacterium]|nr:GDP-mannose 4,6-dehydratase [Solirubrobacteraceae bacterium]
MRYLITGGAGFIGSHLADELLARGDRVQVMDDLSTGSMDNIRHLKDNPRFDYAIESAADPRLVAELVDEADVVFHLAAAVGVDLIVESPVRAIETNVHCTEVVLTHANKKKKPVFVASTSEVYGKSHKLPFREDGDLVLGPTYNGRWSYACSKAIDEYLALAYWSERKLPVVIARLFNTVGPRQTGRYGMVIPSFVRQALAGQTLTVYGDGTQQRCFCHVRDVVRAMVDLMASDDAYGQIFNVGSQEEISIGELARRVVEAAGSESEIGLVSYEDAYAPGFEDMVRRIPDISKIESYIGWRPTTPLGAILEEVIAYHQAPPSGATTGFESDPAPVA